MLCVLQVDSMLQGKTALHVAIEEGSPGVARLLLEYKANMDLQVSDKVYGLRHSPCNSRGGEPNILLWSR